MTEKLIAVEAIEPGLTLVTLDRAARRNALSIELLDQLFACLEALAGDPEQRVFILAGRGPIFSSGLDLKEAGDSALVEASARAVQRALRQLSETPLIAIAAVQGGAFAGGAGLMAACDIALAAAGAKIGFPEVRRGLLPALICRVLRHRVREGDLRELLLAGEAIDAERARSLGLLQRVVPVDCLIDEAVNLGRAILAGGPEAVRNTKRLLNQAFAGDDESILLVTHLTARSGAEACEGLAAFVEKREPNW